LANCLWANGLMGYGLKIRVYVLDRLSFSFLADAVDADKAHCTTTTTTTTAVISCSLGPEALQLVLFRC